MNEVSPLQVEFSVRAKADLQRLDWTERERVLTAIRRYAETRHGDVRIVQVVRLPALRVGDWRIYFQERRDEGVLHIISVEHRSRAYRR